MLFTIKATCFVTIDRNWHFTFANRSAAKILGLDAESIVGEPLDARRNPGEVPRQRADGDDARTANAADFRGQVQFPPDRADLRARVRAAWPVSRLNICATPSAERREAERGGHHRATLVHAQRIAKLGCWYRGRCGSPTWTWSEAPLYDIMGVRADQVRPRLRRPSVAAAHPDDRAVAAAPATKRRCVRGAKVVDIEHRMLWPDGSTRFVRSLALLENSPGVASAVRPRQQDVKENATGVRADVEAPRAPSARRRRCAH